jgi:pilus assembly protein CpaF
LINQDCPEWRRSRPTPPGRRWSSCTLPLLAGETISPRFVVPTVAASVDIVVHAGIDPDGRRRVREIVAVPGRVEADVIEVEPVVAMMAWPLVSRCWMPG